MADAGRKKTDEELAALEKRIASVYQEAAADMEETVKSYFASFTARDLEQQARLEAGEITEAEYTQWRLTQIGRGQRYEAMRDALAERYTNANEIAIAYVNDDMASIYALNRTYTIDTAVAGAESIIGGVNFIRYDEATVKRLLTEAPSLMPHYPEARAVQRGIDLAYGKQQITASVTSGILQGNSAGKIANDLMTRMTDMSSTSAVRAARTAITNAENAGRQDGAEELASKGCIMQKTWIATHDDRTRPEHLEADGQTVPLAEPFDVGGEAMMYPGDSSGSGWNVYNCRCSRKDTVVGFKSILED
ncbi:MAG: phage head morphogenesis protein [Oscillospiraceae bacterium]|nr:phage head morphogenesis protein [Oscillospiraceae bacterium]